MRVYDPYGWGMGDGRWEQAGGSLPIRDGMGGVERIDSTGDRWLDLD
jgi:hypothetical protein